MPSGPLVRPKKAASKPSVRADRPPDIKARPATMETMPPTTPRIITIIKKIWNKSIKANGLGTRLSSAPHIRVSVPMCRKLPSVPTSRRRPYRIHRIPRFRMATPGLDFCFHFRAGPQNMFHERVLCTKSPGHEYRAEPRTKAKTIFSPDVTLHLEPQNAKAFPVARCRRGSAVDFAPRNYWDYAQEGKYIAR